MERLEAGWRIRQKESKPARADTTPLNSLQVGGARRRGVELPAASEGFSSLDDHHVSIPVNRRCSLALPHEALRLAKPRKV